MEPGISDKARHEFIYIYVEADCLLKIAVQQATMLCRRHNEFPQYIRRDVDIVGFTMTKHSWPVSALVSTK